MLDTLSALRVEIDLLDKDIVYLIGQRAKLVAAAGAAKTDIAQVPAPERVAMVINRVTQRAVDIGAPVTVVERTYREMINAFIEHERSLFVAAQDARS